MSITEDTEQTRKRVYRFVFSLAIYSGIQVINWQFGVVNATLLGLVELAAIGVMVFNGFSIFNEVEFESSYLKFMFFLLMAYSFVIIVRGFPSNYPQFKYNIQSDFLFWPFVIPLAIFLNKSNLTLFYFIKSFYLLAVAFLFFSAVNPFLITQRLTAETYIHAFVFPAGFLLMNAKYISKKATIVAFFSLLIAVISFTYLARRNAIVSYAGLLAFGTYFYLRSRSASLLVKLFPLFAGALIILLAVSDNVLPRLTEKLNDRLGEDTRSEVFDNLFTSMEEDLVFGKGMNGTYYSPIGEMLTDDGVKYDEVEFRNIIENGYLQLLLNGGYVYIVLFGLTLLPAVFLGIFKSDNQLTKACAVVILLWLIDMSIYGLPRLLMHYILVWMSAGICYAGSFREKTDEEIAESFEQVGLA